MGKNYSKFIFNNFCNNVPVPCSSYEKIPLPVRHISRKYIYLNIYIFFLKNDLQNLLL